MEIFLIIAALVAGVPHQTKIPMDTIEACTTEAAAFLKYASTDKHASRAAAVCQIEVKEEPVKEHE